MRPNRRPDTCPAMHGRCNGFVPLNETWCASHRKVVEESRARAWKSVQTWNREGRDLDTTEREDIVPA